MLLPAVAVLIVVFCERADDVVASAAPTDTDCPKMASATTSSDALTRTIENRSARVNLVAPGKRRRPADATRPAVNVGKVAPRVNAPAVVVSDPSDTVSVVEVATSERFDATVPNDSGGFGKSASATTVNDASVALLGKRSGRVNRVAPGNDITSVLETWRSVALSDVVARVSPFAAVSRAPPEDSVESPPIKLWRDDVVVSPPEVEPDAAIVVVSSVCPDDVVLSEPPAASDDDVVSRAYPEAAVPTVAPPPAVDAVVFWLSEEDVAAIDAPLPAASVVVV